MGFILLGVGAFVLAALIRSWGKRATPGDEAQTMRTTLLAVLGGFFILLGVIQLIR